MSAVWKYKVAGDSKTEVDLSQTSQRALGASSHASLPLTIQYYSEPLTNYDKTVC